MRRWDRLLDSYMEEYRARGVSPQTDSVHGSSAEQVGAVAQGPAPQDRDRGH